MHVIVTAGSDEKCARCLEHGADEAINYRTEKFEERVREDVDVILDHLGALYLPRRLAALATGGRVVIIGSMGGTAKAEIDVTSLLGKRQQIIGSTLRATAGGLKAALVDIIPRAIRRRLARGPHPPGSSTRCCRWKKRTKRTGS